MPWFLFDASLHFWYVHILIEHAFHCLFLLIIHSLLGCSPHIRHSSFCSLLPVFEHHFVDVESSYPYRVIGHANFLCSPLLALILVPHLVMLFRFVLWVVLCKHPFWELVHLSKYEHVLSFGIGSFLGQGMCIFVMSLLGTSKVQVGGCD